MISSNSFPPYRILFLTADVGHGHLNIHQAIFSKFKEMFPNQSTVSLIELEVTKELNWLKSFITFRSYMFCVEWLPSIYRYVYQLSNKINTETLVNQHRRLLSDNLRDKIMDIDPDMIVSTHPSATAFATILKQDGLISHETIFITFDTDFATGNAYNTEGTLVVPHQRLKEIMERDYKRSPNTTEVIPGLLPRIEFTQEFNRGEMREQIREEIQRETGLTYNLNLPMFLVAGGGEGLRLSDLVKFMPIWKPSTPVVVPIITGKNGKLYRQIQNIIKKGVHPNLLLIPLGYKRNIHEYMKAADILISKPGGATSAETMAVGLPQFAQDYIEGQEKLNIDFLVPLGVIHHIKNLKELNNVVRILNKAESIKEAQQREFPERKTAIEMLPQLFWKVYKTKRPTQLSLTLHQK